MKDTFEKKYINNLGMVYMLSAVTCWFVHNLLCKYTYTSPY